MCANNAIHREIEAGTILLILSKPIGRFQFVASKQAAILAVLVTFIWVNGIGALLAVRIATRQFELESTIFTLYASAICLACIIGAAGNFFLRTSFPSTTFLALVGLFTLALVLVYWIPDYNDGYQWGSHIGYSRNLIAAIALLLLAALIMGAVATLLSVYFHLISNMIVCTIIFLLGLMSDYLYYRVIHMNRENILLLMPLWPYYLLPILSLLWYRSRKRASRDIILPRKTRLVYPMSIMLLIGVGLYNTVTKAEFRTPSVVTVFFANIVHTTKDTVIGILHSLVPNLQLFWMADALVAGNAIPITYLLFGFAYTLCFIVVFLCLTFLVFSRLEVGKQMLR